MKASTLLLRPPQLKPPPIFNNRIIRTSIPIKSLSSTSLRSSSIGNCSTNPCLDLFYNVNAPNYKMKKSEVKADEEASCAYLKQMLPLAWSHNPLTTIKIIHHLVNKQFHTEAYHTAVYWLHQNHPKTLLRNIQLVDCSYTLTQIPYCLLKDKRGRGKAVQILENDSDYKLLRDRVADVLAERLKSDMESLKKQKSKPWNTNCLDDYDQEFLHDQDYDYEEVTGTARNCLIRSWDKAHARSLRATLLLESIAMNVFPRESYPEYQGVEKADYMKKVLDRLRKEVLVPLVNYTNTCFTSKWDRSWETSDYFYDEKYVEEVKAGEAKIVADALLPNTIVGYVHHWNFRRVAELQWKAMVDDMKKKGQEGKKILSSCLAVCGLPALINDSPNVPGEDTWIGFTLLASELNEEPWKGKVISFNSSATNLHLIQGEDLRYKCDFLSKTRRDVCIDLEAVLDLVLQVAVNENLKPDDMIKKVLVFGRTDEDEPFRNNSCWEAKYETIHKKYKEKGYGDVVPHIVYWTMSWVYKPVMPRKLEGVTILTGNNLDKLFLEKNAEIEPEHVVEFAVSGEEYQSLSVVD